MDGSWIHLLYTLLSFHHKISNENKKIKPWCLLPQQNIKETKLDKRIKKKKSQMKKLINF
jgi:hypothetical protein